MVDTLEFLESVITTDSGNLVTCARNHTITWHQEWHDWPNSKDKLANRIEFLRSEYDIYFSSHLFSEESAEKQYVLPSRTIQADLDNAELDSITLEPSFLVETSPKRYQAYWILDEKVTIGPEDLEALSKRITYSINNSDHSGWSLGHRVRVPGTLNFKYTNGPHNITIVSYGGKKYLPEDIEVLPAIQPALLAIHDNGFVDDAEKYANSLGPMELMHNLKDRVPQGVYLDYINKVTSQDRSAALWALMCSLFEANLSREEVFWLAKHSVNNKFKADLRYNADRELAKDVLRAERRVKVKPIDVKGIIDDARVAPTPNIPGGALQKRRMIMATLQSAMTFSGKFLRAVAGLPYFIPNDTGRPIVLTHGSEHLRAMMNLRYGINAADPEWKYLHSGILDLGVSLDETVLEASLSYYKPEENTMYFHSGRRDVLRITSENITRTINGENGILFPWYDMLEPFNPDLNQSFDWGDILFGDLHNATNMPPEQAKALLKAWFIFSLFRSSVSTRPILALFGPPSAGKSTIPHRVYAVLYAKRLAVLGLTNPQEFDAASTRLPVYCIDNLDTYVGWVLDKLAQAIGDTDIIKRKLYTDVDVIRQRRQALICVTAHNPKFTREDITKRLLLITLDEITKTKLAEETEMITHILTERPKIWGAILNDVKRVLATPKPASPTVKWRIQDFATLGERIAIALDMQDDFNAGLTALLDTQSGTIMTQEEPLVDAIRTLLTFPDHDKPMAPHELYQALKTASGDQKTFEKMYKNAQRLNHKLMTVRSSIEHIANIQFDNGLWSINASTQDSSC